MTAKKETEPVSETEDVVNDPPVEYVTREDFDAFVAEVRNNATGM